MPFQPCPNIAQVELIYTASSQPCENVYHVLMDSGWDATKLAALTDDMATWNHAHLRGMQSAEVFLQKIRATDLTTSTGLVHEVAVSPPDQGADTGAPLPNNVTIAVSWRTGLRGRSQRGRTYVIGLTEERLGSDAQEVTSGDAGSIITVFEALIEAIDAVTGRHLVVLSRFHGVDPTTHKPVPRANGVGTIITNVILADPFIDSQRRRLPAHNRHR